MFQGFSQEAFDFLSELQFNNRRDWFMERKPVYQEKIQKPLKVLSNEVFDRFTAKFTDKDYISKVTRIYKDVRRSKGVNPYKTSLWFSLQSPAEHWWGTPSYWFEICPDSWGFGLAIPSSPASMERFRQKVAQNPEGFQKLNRSLARHKELELFGENYAKIKPNCPDGLTKWFQLRRGSIGCYRSDIEFTFDGEQLLEELVTEFSYLKDFYDYFYPISEAGQAPALQFSDLF